MKNLIDLLTLLYEWVEKAFLNLTILVTFFGVPVVLLFTLYHTLFEFDPVKVICGTLLSYILQRVNITAQGGEITWNRTRYR